MLNVDIIVYQDEMGCARENPPQKNMRNNFSKLVKIHEGTRINIWANCENFIWEKANNSCYSTLIPGSFPRYLSQLASVSDAGVLKSLVLAYVVYTISLTHHFQ